MEQHINVYEINTKSLQKSKKLYIKSCIKICNKVGQLTFAHVKMEFNGTSTVPRMAGGMFADRLGGREDNDPMDLMGL